MRKGEAKGDSGFGGEAVAMPGSSCSKILNLLGTAGKVFR